MKPWEKVIIGLIITPIILYAIFYIFFAIGMINSSSRKALDANIVSECNEYLKSINKDLKNVELYYYQGKIFFNINFENNLSLDESKIVIKSLKEFILKDNINKYLTKTHSSHLNMRAVVHSNENSYYYESPYYLGTSNDTDSDSDVNSSYTIWYITEVDGKIIQKINMD